MSGERHIEMTWRCTSCQTRNLGRYKVCQTCRNPKDGSEPYEMPEDTSKAATVTDDALLRMATAGPNWRCAYCGSDQRRTDMGCANCGASAVEGAEVPDDAPEPPADAAAVRPPPAPRPRPAPRRTWLKVGGALLLAAGSCLAFGAVVRWNQNRPRDYTATVTGVKWERTIAVERYQVKADEGFKEQLPAQAFEVKSQGQRQHHTEQVLDHYEPERYSVQVPDGYRTESYTERVSCGRDCRDRPQSCREKCTSNKNGFATCRTVCSGGGQTCTTKYCNERRTRQIPKTRTEWRTRQVAKYRTEPRYAEAFGYKRWVWLPQRTARAEGYDVTVRWPEANLGKDLGPGEQERERRTETYEFELAFDERTVEFAPENEAAFVRFPPGTKHQVHTENGVVLVDGQPMTPAR